MANTVTNRVIVDGPRHVVVHSYIASDGASGELSAVVLVDASALSGTPTKLTIEEVWYSLNGFSGVLEWDATTDVPFWTLSDSDCCFMDFRCFGGISNNAGAGVTGDVVITTSGFTAAGDRGSFVFKLRKD